MFHWDYFLKVLRGLETRLLPSQAEIDEMNILGIVPPEECPLRYLLPSIMLLIPQHDNVFLWQHGGGP
jgi:hypothetical protein